MHMQLCSRQILNLSACLGILSVSKSVSQLVTLSISLSIYLSIHSYGLHYCSGITLWQCTLKPGDCDSFTRKILSQDHREISITESILMGRKVIINVAVLIMSTIWLPV